MRYFEYEEVSMPLYACWDRKHEHGEWYYKNRRVQRMNQEIRKIVGVCC